MASQVLLWFWRQLRRRVGLYAMASVALLYGGMIIVTGSLAGFVRGLSAEQAWLNMVLFAAICWGWWVGRSKRNAWIGWILFLTVGGTVVLFHMGGLWHVAISVARAFLFYLWSLLDWRLYIAPGYHGLLVSAQEFAGVWAGIAGPFGAFGRGLLSGEIHYDRMVALTLWSGGLVLISFWAGWAFRCWGHPLVAWLPAGVVMAASFSYVQEASLSALGIFAGVVLLLTGVNRQYLQEKTWQRGQFDYAEDIRVDTLTAAVTISAFVVVFAILIPAINMRQIVNFFKPPEQATSQTTSGEMGEALGLSVQEPPPNPYEQVVGGDLPRIHLLGTGPELSQKVMMTIAVDEPVTEPPPRYYWRSLTYDIYTGHGWATSATSSQTYREGVNAFSPGENPHVIRQRVHLTEDVGGFLFSAGEILSVNWPFSVAWRETPDGESGDQFAGRVSQNDYQVDAVVPVANVARLQALDASLPDWVRARYLDLPNGIPARVYELAAGVTFAEQTPFDRAVALERYLRAYPYSLDLPTPPTSQDIVDYFLFDLRRGYCDYYASAMAVLARASGLPARLAVGYASGTYDPANRRYVVTEADAHSWVEIYFQGVGWVPFEPTGGQPEIARAETQSGRGETVELPPTPFEPVWARGLHQVGWGMMALFFVGMLGLIGWNRWTGWRLRQRPPDEVAVWVFYQLQLEAKRQGFQVKPGLTPYEFAAFFSLKVDAAGKGRFLGLAPGELGEVGQSIWQLTHAFVRAVYAPEHLTENERHDILRLWLGIRWRLWRIRLRQRLIQLGKHQV